MFNDTLNVVSYSARACWQSFVALMGLYESNYIRFGWLAANLAALDGRHCSSVAADCDLVLNVTERCPYTTTLNLTYLLAHPTEPLEYPDMTIRIYHDARLVEAQAWADIHPHPMVLVPPAQPRGA